MFGVCLERVWGVLGGCLGDVRELFGRCWGDILGCVGDVFGGCVGDVFFVPQTIDSRGCNADYRNQKHCKFNDKLYNPKIRKIIR